MRRSLLALVGIFCISLTVNAASTTIQDYFYKKGKEVGYKEGYKDGYLQAYKDILKALKQYKDDIRAIEVGKYLYRNQMVTAPRIYRVQKPNGEYTIVVKGCEIQDIRTIDEILAKGIKLPAILESEISKDDLVNGNYIVDIDKPVTVPRTELDKVYIYTFKKNRRIKEALDKANIPYEETDSEFRAIFESKESMNMFCETTKLCEGLE